MHRDYNGSIEEAQNAWTGAARITNHQVSAATALSQSLLHHIDMSVRCDTTVCSMILERKCIPLLYFVKTRRIACDGMVLVIRSAQFTILVCI